MTDGFTVDVPQIQSHAARIDAVRGRFAAVRSASAGIAQDDAAFGLLCGWMAGVLEQRHVRHEELLSYVEENLRLATDALIQTGQDYDRADDGAADRIRRAGRL
jgi:Excreted virulence factor EspC, type VII ESX diderm